MCALQWYIDPLEKLKYSYYNYYNYIIIIKITAIYINHIKIQIS